MPKDYSELPKEELLKVVQELNSRKKYGLVWDEERTLEKFEQEARNALPVLKEIKSKFVHTDPLTPINILIEGDNYHALSVLNYTHQAKIDVIYIDPPYNTGAKDWKYNNDFVDKQDTWRHSKWLSFMNNRLRLAKNLLKSDGALICAIDDYELNTLGLLLEEIFPSYEKSIIVVEHHPQGAGSETVSRTHEYAYVLTPLGLGFDGREVIDDEDKWSLKRSGQGENNWRKNRPNSFFAIIVDPRKRKIIGVGPEIPKEKKIYPTGKTTEGYERFYPLDKQGEERVWRYNRTTMERLIKAGDIEYTERGSLVVKKTGEVETPIFSVWTGSRYNAGTHGSNLLTQMMGKANSFSYPKSLYAVIDMISMIVGNKKNAIILDFFAGSGTTGHAVMELNEQDNGNRSFILCTNNENNICEEICYPRVKKVMEGYKFKGMDKKILFEKKITVTDARNGFGDVIEKIVLGYEKKYDEIKLVVEDGLFKILGLRHSDSSKPGLGGNLKYFKTTFVKRSLSADTLKVQITKECTEMLCLREGIFDETKKTNDYRIFKQTERIMAIYYSMDRKELKSLKKDLDKLDGKKILYCFSLDPLGLEEEDFEDWSGVSLEPIPQKILDVYEGIYEH